MYRTLLLSTIVSLAAACGKEPVAPAPKPKTHPGVSVTDNAFTPADLTIRSGEDVTWVWDGQGTHGLQFAGSPTPAVRPTGHGNIYVRAFPTPGVYFYYCPVHGGQAGLGVTGMSGKITVQ